MMSTRHVAFAVPIRIDRDGSPLIPCPWLDGGLDLAADHWGMLCEECGILPGIAIPGTHGVQSIDGLDDAEYEQVERHERMLRVAHKVTVEAAAREILRQVP